MGDWVRVKPPKEVKLIYVVRIQYAHISQKQNTHTQYVLLHSHGHLSSRCQWWTDLVDYMRDMHIYGSAGSDACVAHFLASNFENFRAQKSSFV